MKKFLPSLLALLVTVVALLGMTTTAKAEVLSKTSAKEITAGEIKISNENVVISNVGEYLLYAITASTSGTYAIYTEKAGSLAPDTLGYILNPNTLDTENYLLENNDNFGSDMDCGFALYLEKGQTVYFAVTCEEYTLNRAFNVVVEKSSTYCEKDGVVYKKVENTTETGTTYEYNVCDNNLSELTDVVIPSEIDGIPVTEILDRAFVNCPNIKSVTIPGSVNNIGKWAFGEAYNLRTISLGEGIKTIGDNAFRQIPIEEVNIPASVTDISTSAFMNCEGISSITIGEGSKSYKVVNLVLYTKDMKTLVLAPIGKTGNLKIPEGVETIGERAFYSSKVTKVTLPSTVKKIDKNAFRNSSIQTIVLNEGLETIDYYAFSYCQKLYSVKFPSTLKRIGIEAFSHSSLLCAEIPESVETIEGYAFYECAYNAVVIKGSGTKPSIISGAFSAQTIYGHNGSTAQTYASDKSLTFVSIDLGGAACTHPAGYQLYDYQTKPTCTSEGQGKRKCLICGEEGTYIMVDKLAHNENNVGECQDCGYRESYVSDIGVNESKTYQLGNVDKKVIHYTAKRPGLYTVDISEVNNVDYWFTLGMEELPFNELSNEYRNKITVFLKRDEKIYVTAVTESTAGSFKLSVTCCHKLTSTKVTPATLSADGKAVKSCNICDKVFSTTVIPKVANISLPTTSYIYDGKEKTPAVTVKDSKGKALSRGKDYILEYSSGRKEIGTYKVKVTLQGNYSGSKVLSYSIVPGQVTGLKQWTSEYSTCRIKMSWKKVAGAEGYALYRSTEKNGTYKYLKTVTTTPCTNEGLKAGSKFYYKVRAYKTVSGEKVYGKYSDAVFMVTKPGAPSVTLTAGSKSAKIAWTKSTSANGYEVYMSTKKDGTYTKIKTAGASTLSYTKTGLKSGQKYYIKVRAYMTHPDGSKVYSGWSQLKGVTPK